MIRIIAVAAALALSAPVEAVDLELGLGASHFNDHGSGTWWQAGFPNQVDVSAPSAYIGVVGDPVPWVRARAGYLYVGRASVQAQVIPVDEAYSAGATSPLVHLNASGRLQGVALTLEPHLDRWGWSFGVEAGPYLYKPTWGVDVLDWRAKDGDPVQAVHLRTNETLQWGGVAGLRISKGALSLSYRRVFAAGYDSGNVPPIWRTADTLLVTYRLQ